MEPVCEFCGVVRAVVYCKSDSARLCLHCDGCVHSANSLSRRHQRSLLCDKCNSQPAIVRCMDEKMSLCQVCDWNGNACCSNMGHRCQTLNCYSGCPSMAEFSRIWSSVLDMPSANGLDAGWVPLNTLPINEGCISNTLGQRQNERSSGLVASKLDELEAWMRPSPLVPPNPNYAPFSSDQAPFYPAESNVSKGCSSFKDLGVHDGDNLCEGLNMDGVQLNLENDDEIFGFPQGHSACQFEDLRGDCLLMENTLSVTESNGPIENAIEASSSGQNDCVALQSSCVGGSASMTQAMNGSANCLLMNPCCNRNINLGFPTGQVHSSISMSLSNIAGESSAADYQDCALSPVFLTGESPWESSLEVSCPQARDKAKMRYNEKKKTRTFGKQIRYASRKARADTRNRVKGRFVKAGEAYDYNPLAAKNS